MHKEAVTTPSYMSIRKNGIARWRGSVFSLRMLKKDNKVFCSILVFMQQKRSSNC